MAKSKITFNKREKEKQRQQQKQQKKEKMEERKANSKSKSFDDMMAYIDENGNIVSTPPDPSKKKVFNADEIEIGVPKTEETENEINTGIVDYFNSSKGFGFIKDDDSGERLFFHMSQLHEPLNERDKVTYDIEKGVKGFNAVNIKKL